MGTEKGYTEEYYKSHLDKDGYIDNTAYIGLNQCFAENLKQLLMPGQVLDVGCACGYLVSAFRDLGVNAYGVDSSEYALEHVRSTCRQYCRKGILPDLRLPDGFPEKYDLVTCIEVLEHIPEKDTVKSIQALTNLSDVILFSSSPNDLTEVTHVNVHPLSYWCERFAAEGYFPDVRIDLSFGPPQFILFRKEKKALSAADLFAYMDTQYFTRMLKAKELSDVAVERYNLIKEYQAQVTSKDAELGNLSKLANERLELIKEFQAQIPAKDAELEKLFKLANERLELIKEFQSQLSRFGVFQENFDLLKQVVQDRSDVLKYGHAVLDTCHDFQEKLALAESKNAELAEELSASYDLIQQYLARIKSISAERDSMNQQLQQISAERDSMDRQLQQISAEMEKARQTELNQSKENENLRHEIQDLRASKAFRLAVQLSKIYHIFR